MHRIPSVLNLPAGEMAPLRVRPLTTDLSFYMNGQVGFLGSDYYLPPAPLGDPDPQKSEQLYRSLVKPLVVLSFNDIYDANPFPHKSEGGLIRLQSLLKTDRSRSQLRLFAGDLIGSGRQSLYFKGRQMVQYMNRMHLDAAVIGNHEFDYGLQTALERFQESNFPWLATNLKLSNGQKIPHTKDYVIVERDGIKVGVIGLVEDWVGITNLADQEVEYEDFVTVGQKLSRYLKKKQGVDYVVALTHMEKENDQVLAGAVPGIDLIVGGHDHDFVSFPDLKITKSGCDGLQLGRLALFKDLTGKSKVQIQNQTTKDVSEDQEMLGVVRVFDEEFERQTGLVIAVVDKDLHHKDKIKIRSEETIVGNFITDIFRHAVVDKLAEFGFEDIPIHAAICNAGTIRSHQGEYPAGEITTGDIMGLISSPKKLLLCQLTGQGLLDALENSVSKVESVDGRFLQVSGISYSYDPSQPVGSRLVDASIQGEKIISDKIYHVVMDAYLQNGRDGFVSLKDLPYVIDGVSFDDSYEMVIEWLARQKDDVIAVPGIEGRIKVVSK